MSQPICIVLAGGLGTRLRPAVPDLPKCLAPVGGVPFLALLLRHLASQGVQHFVLSLGYKAEEVQAAMGSFGLQVPVDVSIESQPLGTGGAILQVMHEFGLDEALVVNGDTFIRADLSALMKPLDVAHGEAARMAVLPVDDRARYGGVDVQDGSVRGFFEKGCTGPGLINAGLYHFSRAVFAGQSAGTAFSLEAQTLTDICRAGSLRAALLAGDFIDIGVPEDYFRFCERHAR